MIFHLLKLHVTYIHGSASCDRCLTFNLQVNRLVPTEDAGLTLGMFLRPRFPSIDKVPLPDASS
jgi:hypothetical protein